MLALAGFNGGRLVAFSHDRRFYDYVAQLQTARMELAVCMASESFQSGSYAADAALIASQVKAPTYVLGNEQDAWMLPVESPSSWKMMPNEYAVMFGTVATAILQVQPDARLVIGGFVAGQPTALRDYLAAIRQVYTGPIHGYDLHPYTQSAGNTAYMFGQYDQFIEPGMWGYALEINRPAVEIPEYVAMLGDTNWCYFCWSDLQVEGFGLLDGNGWPKAEARALSRVLP